MEINRHENQKGVLVGVGVGVEKYKRTLVS